MKLHEQIKKQAARVESFINGINHLRRHLRTEKFHVDTTVQVSDILMILDNIMSDDSIIDTLRR